MKLYGTLTSPYVRKVRAFLLEKGLVHEFIVEAASDPAGNVPRLNPLGKVPVLGATTVRRCSILRSSLTISTAWAAHR